MPQSHLKVVLISHTADPEATVTAGIRQCYSVTGAVELKEKTGTDKQKKLIDQVIASGHHSTIEHASFTFAVEGISRACSHQLVRHRLASYSQQSQRYVNFEKSGFDYVIPPKIQNNPEALAKFEKLMAEIDLTYKSLQNDYNILPEDARFVLPNAADTKIVITMNARALLNFFRERLCLRAQWEIREMARLMLEEVKPIAPEIFKYAGPSCQTEKICWEGNLSCGLWKSIDGAELRGRFASYSPEK